MKVNTKSKRTLKEMSNEYSSDFMKKYNDINIIHFNENMSMVNKMDNMNFSPASYSGFFKTNPLLEARNKSMRDWGVESACYDFSSDDRETLTSTTGSRYSNPDRRKMSTTCYKLELPEEDHRNDVAGAMVSELDSFCTLCTSSFSFSNCNNCEKSSCGSKCSNERSGNLVESDDDEEDGERVEIVDATDKIINAG